ncbi:MAG: hypothetical protein A2X12_01815 [Bacteroidetes bacterium GWE2_29_8]|nr:MAG: hypothetical protein A2X12_01815 [Bacteroidetes bacterium GWE2_29_8]
MPIAPISIGPSNSYSMLFFTHVNSFFLEFPIVNKTFAFILLIVQSIIITVLFNYSSFVKKETYLPAFIYILLYLFFNKQLILNSALLANFLILISLFLNFKSYVIKKPYSKILNSTILISIASLFYFPVLFLVIVIWLSFFNYSMYKWREWVISIMGLLIPYIFIFMYYFMIDDLYLFNNIKLNYFKLSLNYRNILDLSYIQLITLGFLIILILTSFIHFLKKIDEGLIKVRKYKIMIFWITLIFITINALFFYNLKDFTNMIIPISILLSYYFLTSLKKIFIGIIFYLMIVLIILSNYILI